VFNKFLVQSLCGGVTCICCNGKSC